MEQPTLDKIDLKILNILARDARTSYRSMAMTIGLTAKSIKARVDKMVSNGVIENFWVKVNPAIFEYSKLCLLLVQQSKVAKDTCDRLNLVGDLVCKQRYVGGITGCVLAVKEDSEDKIDLAIDALKPALVQSMFISSPHVNTDLSATDYKIIKCLLSNPRIEISDIAKAISSSAKTVGRRLTKMLENHVLEFSIHCNAAALGGYIMFNMIINVEKSFYRSVLEQIYSDLQEYFLFPSAITDQENLIALVLLSKDVFTLDSILTRIESYEGVKKAEMALPIRAETHYEWITRGINRKLATERVPATATPVIASTNEDLTMDRISRKSR